MFNSIQQLRGLLLIILLCFITACGSDSSSDPTYVTEVNLFADNTSIPVNLSQLIEGEAIYSNGDKHSASSGNSVWTSNDEKIATVDNTGLVTAVSEGSTQIFARYLGGSDADEPVTGEITITVVPAVITEIEIYSEVNDAPLGIDVQYKVMGIYSNGNVDELENNGEVIWASSDPLIADIDSVTGLAETLSKGQTTISANFEGMQSSAILKVTSATLVSLTISPAEAGVTSVAAGYSINFTAEAAYSDDTTQPVTNQVTWITSDRTILSLSEIKGTFKGVASGDAEVTAMLETITSTVIPVTVTPELLLSVSIETDPESVYSYPDGLSTQLIAMGHFSNDSNKELTSTDNVSILWENTPNDVISLEAEGLLTGENPGESTVFLTVTPVNKEALKAQQDFTITDAELVTATITAVPNDLYLVPGQSHQYIAIGEYTDRSKHILNNQEDIFWSVGELLSNSDSGSAVSINPKTGLIRNHFYNGLAQTDQVLVYVTVGGLGGEPDATYANLGAVRVLTSDNLSFTGTFIQYDVIQLGLTITSEEVNNEDGMSGPDQQPFIMLTYEEAESVCQELVYNKHTNYRLPTSDELMKLWNDKTTDPAVDYEFYTKYNWSVGKNYWTSTTEDSGVSYKVIDLGKGELQLPSMSTEYNYVSCVRSTVSPEYQ